MSCLVLFVCFGTTKYQYQHLLSILHSRSVGMSSPCQVIAVSGVSEFRKDICEELLASIEYDVDIAWTGISALL
jgi:hypothetical protein